MSKMVEGCISPGSGLYLRGMPQARGYCRKADTPQDATWKGWGNLCSSQCEDGLQKLSQKNSLWRVSIEVQRRCRNEIHNKYGGFRRNNWNPVE